MTNNNQTPEQRARDNIDAMLDDAGWHVQNKDKIDFLTVHCHVARSIYTDPHLIAPNSQSRQSDATPDNTGFTEFSSHYQYSAAPLFRILLRAVSHRE